MKGGSPFARAIAMMAAIASVMSNFANDTVGRQVAMAGMPQYRSRGKGEGRSNRVPRGAGMAAKRASIKARNVKRHRAAVRG